MQNGLINQFHDIEDIKKNWGWFFVLGLLLVFLGGAVISSSYYATVFSMLFLGYFLLGAGLIEIFQAFLARQWSGLFLSLLVGVLYMITGLLFVANPAAAAISLTFWIAIFCLAIGAFKMLSSLFIRFDEWGWVFFNGLVTFALGAMIYSGWPLSGLWVIGLFLGIDMLLSGWSWIILSLAARSHRTDIQKS